MAIKGQKNFSVNVNEALSDEFSAQVDDRGYTKYRAIEGALRAFMVLSPDEQVKLMSASNSKSSETTPKNSLHKALEMIKEMTEVEKQQPGTVYRVLSVDEQKILDEFRDLITSQPKN